MRTGGKTAEAAEKRKEKTMTNGGKLALFFGGALFGSAGLRILSGRDARKVYSHTTAAVLRCRDEIMKHVELVQEGCSDILPTRSRSTPIAKKWRKRSSSKKAPGHEIPDHASLRCSGSGGGRGAGGSSSVRDNSHRLASCSASFLAFDGVVPSGGLQVVVFLICFPA